MVKTYGELYLEVRNSLLGTEDSQAAANIARQILCKETGLSREQFLVSCGLQADEIICSAVRQDANRLQSGEPLAYVLGEWEFYGLPLTVTPDVLIPRDDTCAVTELAINQTLFLNQAPRILDLCCGSGCIGLAVASRVKDARVTLADISRDALSVARKNVQQNMLGGRVSCCQVNALQEPPSFLGLFDLIVSNPPYITQEEMKELPESVAGYEPYIALYGGADGLDFYRSITSHYTQALKPGGYLCFEFGMGQGNAVCSILQEAGFEIIERKKDFNNRERAVIAQYCRKED